MLLLVRIISLSMFSLILAKNTGIKIRKIREGFKILLHRIQLEDCIKWQVDACLDF